LILNLSGRPLLFGEIIVKVKIELCMGSSCFARGNSRVLSILESHIKEIKQSEKVQIIGHLCMNNCSCGPVVRINNTEYLDLNEIELIEIIDTQLGVSL
jgi:NADH:ubiquinone oxidoreductase subunit E